MYEYLQSKSCMELAGISGDCTLPAMNMMARYA